MIDRLLRGSCRRFGSPPTKSKPPKHVIRTPILSLFGKVLQPRPTSALTINLPLSSVRLSLLIEMGPHRAWRNSLITFGKLLFHRGPDRRLSGPFQKAEFHIESIGCRRSTWGPTLAPTHTATHATQQQCVKMGDRNYSTTALQGRRRCTRQ